MIEGLSIYQLEKYNEEFREKLSIFKNRVHNAFNQGKPIVIFGTGDVGVAYLQVIRNICPVDLIFCDNNPSKEGTIFQGIPVIGFSELKIKYSECDIIIATVDYFEEIFYQLKINDLTSNLIEGFDVVLFINGYENYADVVKENFELFLKVYNDLDDSYSKKVLFERILYCISSNPKFLIPLMSKNTQYFDLEILKLSNREILIDGGAYIGDTVEEFLRVTTSKFDKVYAFEPEKSKSLEFLKKHGQNHNIELLPYGLWSQSDVLRFSASNAPSSTIDANGDIEIPVISIDEFLRGNPATYIKMDIEGSELEALKGAKSTIQEYKPKLAICVYHKPLDIIQIPIYIKKLVPEYKLYLRHYSRVYNETVLYAIPN